MNNMKKTRFAETKIDKTPKERTIPCSIEDFCREMEVSRTMLNNWKNKYGSILALGIKCLKELEEENDRLKRMYVSLSLDYNVLKDVIKTKT